MTSPQDPSSDPVDPLERAQARLDEACASLADRLDQLAARAGDGAEGQAGEEVAALEQALAAARTREMALASAAGEASQALGEAMAQLRTLSQDGGGS